MQHEKGNVLNFVVMATTFFKIRYQSNNGEMYSATAEYDWNC